MRASVCKPIPFCLQMTRPRTVQWKRTHAGLSCPAWCCGQSLMLRLPGQTSGVTPSEDDNQMLVGAPQWPRKVHSVKSTPAPQTTLKSVFFMQGECNAKKRPLRKTTPQNMSSGGPPMDSVNLEGFWDKCRKVHVGTYARRVTARIYYEARNDYTKKLDIILLCNRCACNWKVHSQTINVCNWHVHRKYLMKAPNYTK